MSQSEILNFSMLDLQIVADALKQPWQPIENLTRNYYFKAVKYALVGIDAGVLNLGDVQRKKMKEQMQFKAKRLGLNPDIFVSDDVCVYNKYTTGWVGDAIDNFGAIKNPDCPVDFAKWYDGYAYSGGHPFEIYPYICLYVRRCGKRFYLELADFKVGNVVPSEKVLKMFMALRQMGVNVGLRDKDLFLKYWQNYNLKSR